MKTPTNLRLLTPKAVFEMTSIPVGTLSRWRCIGIGPPYIKLGTGPKARIRYDLVDVLRFIEEGRRYPTVRAN